jgi:hypothetical protein
LHLAASDPLSIAFEHDFNYYLPDDLLKKVDLASMLTGLECRSPFLDHRLVEFCFRIPPTLKIAGGVPKHLLRRALADELPRAIVERPKQGFGSPVRHWVQGPLRDLARDLLRPGCRCDAYLDGKTENIVGFVRLGNVVVNNEVFDESVVAPVGADGSISGGGNRIRIDRSRPADGVTPTSSSTRSPGISRARRPRTARTQAAPARRELRCAAVPVARRLRAHAAGRP